MKFVVDKKFFDKVDNACFGVIIARGIDNTKDYPFIKELLNKEINNISKKYQDKKVKELPEIELYREAFRKLDINPNKYMCSIEALVSRTVKSKHIPNINPIVDLGNALSLKYRIPLGIHDIDRFRGDIEIRFANSDDRFVPFGGGDYDNPDVGEVIYVSGNDVKTRRWTWRQGENSKVDENINNAFIAFRFLYIFLRFLSRKCHAQYCVLFKVFCKFSGNHPLSHHDDPVCDHLCFFYIG